MAGTWGGARTPGQPAAVSGPGALSARTDGGVMNPNSPSYGEGATLETLKAGAPTGAPSAGSAPTGAPVDPLAGIAGLGAPTQAPGMPVTAGASAGAGPGPQALGLPMDEIEERAADAKTLGPAAIQAMIAAAGRPDATPSFRRLVRTVLYS